MAVGNGTILHEVEALYTGNVRRLGLDSKSVGWRDEATHRLRFDKLVQGLIPVESNDSFTVNDIGSGYGAMFRYLDERYGRRLTRYYGYEISDAMIEASRAFIPDDHRAEIHKINVPEFEADYSFVCGTFNVKFQADDQTWDAYVKDMILCMAQHSRRGFSFNLLTSYVDWKEPHLYYADPAHYFDFCKRYVSRKVALLHDYPLYEWTLIVVK
jgi:SAM-dependent methyltransferase